MMSFKLGNRLFFGKVNPEDGSWNYDIFQYKEERLWAGTNYPSDFSLNDEILAEGIEAEKLRFLFLEYLPKNLASQIVDVDLIYENKENLRERFRQVEKLAKVTGEHQLWEINQQLSQAKNTGPGEVLSFDSKKRN